jgi:two-component system, OmpR family, sensor histidine kinase KdpD
VAVIVTRFDAGSSTTRQGGTRARQDPVKMARAWRFVLALAVVAAVTVVARVAGVDLAAAALLLLVAVVALSLLGLPVALVSAAAAFVSLNYYFTPPRGSFRISDGDDLAALIVFVAAATIVGTVVNLLDRARRTAQRREEETHLRLDLTNRLLEGTSLDETLTEITGSLCRLFELSSCRVRAGTVEARSGTAPANGDEALHIESGTVVLDAQSTRPLTRADRELLEALVAGVGTAVDRLRFETEARDARVAAEVGEARAAFLSGVSHNLRTPLAAVKAAASTLLAPDAALSDADRTELLDMIRDESERLERLVRNTLTMSRITGGGLQFTPATVDVREVIGIALRRVGPLATGHVLTADVDADLPELALDEVVLEHVLLNLLENALRFAPRGSEIRVTAGLTATNELELRVVDHGPGVPAAEREHIFGEFATGSVRGSGGTGLGLAIVRALTAAHGGTVRVDETPGGGATFVCTFAPGTT